jgi:hypothetical protein
METGDLLITVKVYKDDLLIFESITSSLSALGYINVFPVTNGYEIEYQWPNNRSCTFSSSSILDD